MPDSQPTSASRAVFLSYASQDAEAAKRICAALRAVGTEVWFDQNELRGGDTWDQKIRRQIKECALFVPIVSANTQSRPEGYFRLEWRLADQRTHLMGRNKAFIVPACVDQTPDAGADVPDSFVSVQWMRLPAGETPPAVAEHIQRLLAGSVSTLTLPAGPSKSAPRATGAVPHAEENSVAVLAFANLSSDPDNEFFSDGISEELINVLVGVPGLKVSARTSAFHFKGKHTPIPEIARQLGVAHVVEGSVRKAGDRVRITAQLIKAAGGFHVWSETFTRDLKDIFAVQDEIAGLIAKSLSLKLGPAPRAAREVNPAAYRLFLEGRTIFNREVPAEYPKAIQCYQQSLELDPDSALTWAWLGTLYSLSAGSGIHSIEVGNALAREAAQRAIALDPNLAKGHLALAFAEILHGWDWNEAVALLRRARELTPGNVETLSMLAQLAGIMGRCDEAVDLARQAIEIDPLNYFSNHALLRSLGNAGRFEEMERDAERAISVNPSGLRNRWFLFVARLQLGRIDAAARSAEEIPAGWARLTALSCVRYAQGRTAESDTALAELKAHHVPQAAYQVAQVHAFRGEIDEAFRWLEESYRVRDSGTALTKSDPLMRNLRADPRWLPFLRKLQLADDQLL